MRAHALFSWIREQRRSLSVLALLAAVTAAPLACSDKDPLPGMSGSGGQHGTCVDEDGDGYGDGCAAGTDCDDADPSVTYECYACNKPRPGCPCSTEGQRADCGQVESQVGEQVTCGYGETICQGGVWGSCVINNSVTLLPGGDPKTKSKPTALGPPSTCTANPCDPYCMTWPDTPGGLGDPGNGIVEVDGGLSIPLGDAGPPPVSACTGGSIGSCAHHVCETGGALTAGCDSTSATQCLSNGTACPGVAPCCYGLSCVSGTCQVPPPTVPAVRFEETFSNLNAQGWTLGGWSIGVAAGGSGDPSTDTTPTADNRLAGTVIGGSYSNNVNWSFLSPTINLTGPGTMTLTLRSWERFEPNFDYGRIYVSTNNGTSWTQIYSTSDNVGTWKSLSFDVSAYKSNQFRLRFQLQSDGSIVNGGWSLDDILITELVPAPACNPPGAACSGSQPCCSSSACVGGVCTTPSTSCVSAVCAIDPTCCSGSWGPNCVNLIGTACGGASCAIDSATNQCRFCWADAMDHDGDGYSFAQGDCKDCDPTINPGAYDFPGNGVDEDCSGTPDDAVASCDTALTFASDDPLQYARAVDLCRFTTAGASGAAKTWGVISAELVRADGSACSDNRQRAITSLWGANNTPQFGANMAVFSSGTARDANDPGYINPNGQIASYQSGHTVTPPAGFPKSAAGCPNGSAAHDSCGLRLTIRAPTNALSFSYKFDFFSTEYPEWVCTPYNDSFIALYNGALNPYADKNISFDANNNPVSVNAGFFSIPGTTSATPTHPHLAGTGFDGSCGGQVCGGATGWLVTTAPVNPGETFTLHYSIWDTGDRVWDSTVLLDDFRWSPNTSTIETLPSLPPPPPPQYTAGNFVREYDAAQACPAGTKPVWGHWSWTATTPNDSRINYYVTTATTQAGLATAPEDQLRFSNPPGPVAVTGQHASAKTTPVDTQNGAAVVDSTLLSAGRPRDNRFVRIRSHLLPSSDGYSAPVLHAWNLEISCKPNE